MEPLRGALEELEHAFGGVAYTAARAHASTAPRPQVPYDGVKPGAAPPAGPQRSHHRSGSQRPHPAQRPKKRVDTLPRWVDLDDAATPRDPALLAAACAGHKKGPGCNEADDTEGADGAVVLGADAPGGFEALLLQHVHSRPGRERRDSEGAQPASNLTLAGEPIDDATRNVARLVSARLEETMDDARGTIERIIALLGTEKVLELLERAESTDSSGGLLTCDGTKRRRTRGGIFFYLVKQMTNRKEKSYLWPSVSSGETQSAGRGGGHKPHRGGRGAQGRGAGRGGRSSEARY
ncbi:hypothetical protein T492DRAFT_1090898 [Pavlovales sp. CCMP2436]|nr:hypothetical protein T492DRAFT_1090898 [Pavlovales sp. CCMP2436]